MLKVVASLKRRAGLSREEFASYYFERHAPLFRRVVPASVAKGIVHYVQNHAVELGTGRSEPPFDCVTEMGFEDFEAMKRWTEWYRGEEGKVLRDDEEKFMDVAARVVVLTEERRPA